MRTRIFKMLASCALVASGLWVAGCEGAVKMEGATGAWDGDGEGACLQDFIECTGDPDQQLVCRCRMDLWECSRNPAKCRNGPGSPAPVGTSGPGSPAGAGGNGSTTGVVGEANTNQASIPPGGGAYACADGLAGAAPKIVGVDACGRDA